MEGKKDRKPNFTSSDELILMEEVCRRREVLLGSFAGAGGGNKKKELAWAEVVSCLNSQSSTGVSRYEKEVKKKFENIKSNAKSKLTLRRNPPTGGGPPPKDLSLAEQVYVEMAADIPGLNGIETGIDSSSIVSVELATNASDPYPSTSSAVMPADITLHPTPASTVNPTPKVPRKRLFNQCNDEMYAEVLGKEKIRIEAENELARAKLCHANEQHSLKMENLKLKNQYYKQLLGLD